MSSLLVTGSSGFIGRALCPALRLGGHAVVEMTRSNGDICDAATFDRIGNADHVIHLAGSTYVPDSWTDPLSFHRTNVMGTASVLEYCRRSGARLTFVSSYLYGTPERLPVAESAVPRPNNPYALSKLLAEQLCEFYAAHHATNVAVLRPFNVFGPGQKKHFLIPKILDQVIQGKPIQIKDLAPRRDYVYIDDLIDALVKTLDAPAGYNLCNIGSGVSISVKESIDIIQSVAGSHLPVICDGEVRPNEINDVYADINRARALLAWRPRLTFREGIERMLAEHRGNR